MSEKELAYITLTKTIMPPFSVIYGAAVPLSKLINNLITYYFPSVQRIYDPTCGEENFQFKDYLIKRDKWYYTLENGRVVEYVASDIKKTKWNCDGDNCLIVNLLKPPYPFKDEEFDVIVYDPPFQPTSSDTNRRAEAYGLKEDATIYYVKRYHSEKIYKEFHRIVKIGVITRGQDFYYPTNTDKLYLFFNDILDVNMLRKYFRIVSVHIYRYFNRSNLLNRVRLGQSITKKNYRRCMITHSYFVILYKK